jgi:hypothetical protein
MCCTRQSPHTDRGRMHVPAPQPPCCDVQEKDKVAHSSDSRMTRSCAYATSKQPCRRPPTVDKHTTKTYRGYRPCSQSCTSQKCKGCSTKTAWHTKLNADNCRVTSTAAACRLCCQALKRRGRLAAAAAAGTPRPAAAAAAAAAMAPWFCRSASAYPYELLKRFVEGGSSPVACRARVRSAASLSSLSARSLASARALAASSSAAALPAALRRLCCFALSCVGWKQHQVQHTLASAADKMLSGCGVMGCCRQLGPGPYPSAAKL